MIKIDRDGNSDRFAITGRTGRIGSNGNLSTLDRGPLQVALDGGLDSGCRRAVEDRHPRPFSRGVRNDLLNHDHAPKLDHPENHQEEEGGDNRELDYGSPSSVSSAQSAEFLQPETPP